MRVWLALARRPDVVRRAAKTALIVGPILLLINHGDLVLGGTADVARIVKMLLTMAVPYGVSTWSSVGAIRAATLAATLSATLSAKDV
jgi:hypothetical protein